MPYAEILLGIYFGFTVVYAISNQNFATIPFLLLFVWGYLYTGFMSLGQTYFAHLRFASTPPTSARLLRRSRLLRAIWQMAAGRARL